MRWLWLILLFALFLLRLDMIPNDDTYVYFNYARTTVEGLPFCYDGRGLPSEGFTSILYLLLLLPFEALGVNMMFTSVLLNLLALIAILFLFEKIMEHSSWLPQKWVPWAASVAWGLLLLDPHLAEVVGRGLETIVGIASYLVAAYCWLRAVKQPNMVRWWFSFLGSCLLSFWIRPETAPPLAVAAFLLFIFSSNKKEKLLQGLPFIVIFMAYLLWKFLYFNDFWPTAFYRKVQAGHLDGYVYIRSWALAYWPHLLISLLACIGWGISDWRKSKQLQKLVAPLTLFLVGSGLYLLIFHRYVLPMVGYGFRHVFLVTCILYLGLGILGTKILCEINKGQKMILGLVMGALMTIAIVQAWPLQASKWRLYAQAEQAVDDFYYIKLGRFLREHIPNHREITLIYGDAGALPYELRSKFIDTNGLSEPAIARFFQRADSRQKADDFAKYLLSWSPDLLIIAGDTASDGRVPHAITQHDPFRALRDWGNYSSEKLWAYERLKQAGFSYHHSSTGYFYDLHFLINQASPFAQEIQAALSAHQTSFETYQLKEGLSFYNKKREVGFGLF